jgi:hypothetical protein
LDLLYLLNLNQTDSHHIEPYPLISYQKEMYEFV